MRDLGVLAGAGAGLAAFVAAGAVTWVVWHLSRCWPLMDQSNERSAHQQPMPTAGGLGMAVGAGRLVAEVFRVERKDRGFV